MGTPIGALGDVFEFATVATPTIYTTLAGVQSIAESGEKVQQEKTTTLATAGGVDTFQATTQDPGSFDVKGLFYPGDASQVGLQTIKAAGSAVNMKVTYSSSNSTSFSGIVESFVVNYGTPDKLATFDLKVKVTGAKTYA